MMKLRMEKAYHVQLSSFSARKLTFIFLVWMVTPLLCQITPPPDTGSGPVISDNRIWYLKHIPQRCRPPIIDTFNGGGLIKDNRALLKKDNPHIIRGNIEIAPSGCLYIEPGTVMKFAPGMGMIVNGTLIARGSEIPGGRITMTKAQGEDLGQPSGDWQDDARLSMGNTTRDGRLDLKYMGKWRAICTNYNNFTEIDANVTCRHLGFLKGNFTYHSFARNLTDYILWEKPDCTGSENNLFDCPGAINMLTGRHICDGQEVIGFQCEGLRPGLALDHWRGIDFYNSTTEARYQIQNNNRVYMNESLSFLEYLDISYTGLDTYHGQTSEIDVFYQKAAISASPHVPMINNVTIRYGAYDGLNLTEVIGPIHIANSTISNNRGYGMFIQSSVGRTLVNMTEVDNNWGDGIKFYLSNLTIFDFRTKFPPETSFCAMGNTDQVTFPFYQHMDLVQVNGDEVSKIPVGGYCERVFTTAKDMKIGVHFMIMERDPDAKGRFLFRDGGELGVPLETVEINNGSFPESITTKTNILHVRFEYDQPRNLICKTFPPCVRFLLEFTSGYDVEEEFRLLMSNVHDNIGYGVNIQDMRSKVRISNETVISKNNFGAGIHVYKGAGEIVINGTRVEGNADAGINITYSGGYQLINNTQVVANKGYGIITEYLKLNRTRFESRLKVEVVRTRVTWNELIGLRMGNYCRGGEILVNESYFSYNRDEAIEYLSCNITTPKKTRFRVEFNTFNDNFRHAILMRPLLNTEGVITNNTFANHSLSTLRIDNGYDLLISRWYREFPVDFNIFENSFVENMGRYVINIRLTQYSAAQKLYCKFNYFQRNEINDSFMYVNPRSRANAVIVLSSSNVQFRRNYVDNPLSVREVATHLVDPSIMIDAKENYWGTEINKQSDYEKVYMGIFDQDDRYNLAQVQFHPALKTVRLYENILSYDVPEYVWQFQRGNVIGGTLERTFVVGPGKTYYVDKDIYIFPDKTLLLDPGSSLKFAPSVGMVVHGVLRADGIRASSPVSFGLDDREEFVPMENRTANSSIRIVEGYDEFEGRLEVEINGQWGTVCNDGWIEENSLLTCLQLGLSFSRENPVARIQRRAPDSTPVLMSWVSCGETDIDLTKCRAVNDDAHTCSHDKDVYIRCQPPTWAGITLAAAYKHDQQQPTQVESQIRFVQINNAGLLDPDTATLTPALRIDFNYYKVSYLSIFNSLSDSVYISYNHPYAPNQLEYLTIRNSAGNAVVTKSPKVDLMHSRIENNQKAGFLYDPFFTEYDALLVRNMIYPLRRIDMFAQAQRVVAPNQMMFLICQAGSNIETKTYIVEVRASMSNYKLAVQIWDYLPVESVEKVTIFDSNRNDIGFANTKRWEIEKDLVDFPILSGASVITIRLQLTNGQLSGRLAVAIIPEPYQTLPPQLRTSVVNTTLSGNDQGIVTKHYNSPSNKRLELFHRHKVEEILIQNVRIYNSKRHTMHMPSVTKFHEDYIPTYEDMTVPERVAKIIYTVTNSVFNNNAYGILAEHNHVDFANNVWQWKVDHCSMQGTKGGGLEIEVPRVNDETEREIHAVHVFDTSFQNNQDFACKIAGYFADVKIDRNGFVNNRCLLGLISITGMEKNLTMNSNLIQENDCRYMVDMDILSHSEYYVSVKGQMDLNEIINNRYTGLEPPGSAYSPKTYAVAVRGLQDIKANRNIFRNPSLDYELVAGITALSLGNPVDVTANYWGYQDQPTIRQRIFDFDDWNNFAIAEFFPYLTLPDRNSTPSTGVREEIHLGASELGGRVEKSQILMEIGQPYVVVSDLTILPGITLTIPPGTELQFRPNVGILVLGRLVANGLPFSRIKFKPLQPSFSPLNPGRKKREISYLDRHKRDSANIRLRGDGTLFKDAGFLELYNASSKSWNMMCDSQFNEKTAEVVCRELGKEVINVKVRYTHLYDHYIFGKPMYFRKEFWFNSYYCRGDETSLSQCITRYNYNLLPCIFAANYTFITCGKRNLEPEVEYWGNIRFGTDAYEEKPLEADIGVDRSSMSYVDIEGAGMLHGEKVGAIQTTYVTPIFHNINISKCAENGYDVVAPRQDLDIQLQNISGNLGFGVNVLVLNGESSMRKSSFLPNGPSTIPYFIHGLVDICRLEKEIFLETRMILYYKYGPQMRDCVKIISSRKTIGLRLLQINLFQEDFARNVIEIFDGKEVSEQNRIGNILANSSSDDIQKIYESTGTTMSVHVHASISQGVYGFIAEVIKLPLSGLTYPNSEFSHSIQQAEIRGNEDGAIQYKNVGETNPSLFIEHCWLSHNGYPILNLTSPPTIDISLQSTIQFRFSHNQISYNHGGMYLFAHTSAINTALRGNMTNNVFAFGSNGEALNISGHYFERLMLYQNYIYNYTAGDYRDVIHIKDVVVNLTHNYITKNVGHYIIHTYNSDDSTDPQIYARNGIYGNNATALRESTIKIGKGRPKFMNNYFVNTLNDFEMETYPKTMQTFSANIDAKNNWWGSERQAYINGKTYDYSDDSRLVEVEFWPPILDNRSMIEGNCLPGWVLDKKRCYRYMGGALPFEDAKLFCQSHGAFLAEARDREGFFNYLIRLMVIEQDWAQRVWVMSEVGSGRCAAFEKSYIVYEQDCGRRYYPFICETDPDVAPPSDLTSAVKAMIIGISVGVGGVIIIIIIVIAVLMLLKSKRREKERFERTASIRSSLNNLTKINSSLRGTKSTLTMMSEGASRRRLNELDERSMDSSLAKNSQSSAVSNGINGSVHSISSGYEVNQNPEPAPPRRDYNTTGRPVHSLRPDRSAAGRPAQYQRKEAERDRDRDERDRNERERQRERRRKEEESRRQRSRYSRDDEDDDDEDEERGKYEESSGSGSVDKEDFDSSFDDDEEEAMETSRGRGEDDIDAKNMQYHVNRSNERLVQPPMVPLLPGKPGFHPLPRETSRESDQSDFQDNPHKSKSLSSFTDPIESPGRNLQFPPRTTSRDHNPPPDPRIFKSSPELDKPSPKPAPRPKPVPPARTDDTRPAFGTGRGRWSPAPSDRTFDSQRSAPAPAPRQKSLDSQDHLYNNERGPQTPLYDPVYDPKPQTRRPFYTNVKDSDQESSRGPLYDPVYDGQSSKGSQGFPTYDPVYDGRSSDQSRSTDRYEPVEYNPPTARSPYGVDQAPDTDYMPRPLGSNPSLGRSRDRLGAPPPAPPSKPSNFRGPLQSDVDSYAPSLHSDVDYMPRKFQDAGNSRFNDSLPPKPGASSSSDERYPSVSSQDSRGNLHSLPRPPPYSAEPSYQSSRSRSRDRLDLTGDSRGHHQDEPPPYSPGEELMPRRHGGSQDVLYLSQGARPKSHDPIETEI